MSPVISVISQPRFIPALSYLHRMMIADVFVWLDNVQYTPRDWENRNKVKGPAGGKWMSVPVVQVSREQKICDTMIDNTQDWLPTHLKTLQHFYGKALYFQDMMKVIEPVLLQKWERLMDLNIAIVHAACPLLDINCRFMTATEIGVDGKGENLLIEACRKIGSDFYVSGSMGRNYIAAETWQKAGIKLAYHDYNHPVYRQINGDFLPWMSFIDLVANVGFDKAGSIIRQGNVTRQDLIVQAEVV